jgi:hypothetical protein
VVQKLAGSGRLAFSFVTSGLSSLNAHVNHGFYARNDTMDLFAIEPRKQMARRIPALNQDEFNICTLDIYGLELFPKPQPKPRHFYLIRDRTPLLPTDMPYMAPKTTSYRTTGACL